MRAAWNRWAVALRIARRGALRSWGQSLLIMALVAVPVAGLAGAAVFLPSTRSTLAERIQNDLGHAQAKLTVVGTPADKVEQGVEGGYDYSTSGTGTQSAAVDPRSVIPSVELLPVASGAGTFRTEQGAVSLTVQTGATWDPSLDGGPYVLLSGRRPAAPDEILVSPAALTRLGAHIGGSIDLLQPWARRLTVVGTERDRSLPSDAETVFAATSVLPAVTDATGLTYYAPDTPIDWPTIERLNAAGTTVFSRAVVLHPPVLPPSRQYGESGFPPVTAALIAIGCAFALIEVALLAGAAFAVGARLQQRLLATVASVGGEAAALRQIVTASGVVLGALGGLAGILIGVAGALVLMHLTDDGSWTRYPGVHIEWPLLAGILLFGVLVGWASALVPARAAAKIDVVRALRGARIPQRVGRTPVLGIVLLITGVVMTLAGGGVLLATLQSKDGSSTAQQLGAIGLVGGGPVIAQIGVVLCAGLVLRGVTRLLTRAPLPARMAARDTSRNLGRAVPAVAAVMSTVFLASFAMCIANTASIDSATQYSWSAARIGDADIPVLGRATEYPTAQDADAAVSVIRHDLPVARIATVAQSRQDEATAKPSAMKKDALPVVRFPDTPICSARAGRDPADLRCGPFTANGGSGINAQNFVSIGDLDALALTLGHAPSAAAAAALERGDAVALRSDLAPGGDATLDWFTPKQLTTVDVQTAKPVRSTRIATIVDLPAHPVPGIGAPDIAVRAYPDILLDAPPLDPTAAGGPPPVVLDANGFLATFDDEAIDTLLAAHAARGTAMLMIRYLGGGAFGDIAPDATALAFREAEAFVVTAAFAAPDAPSETVHDLVAAWAPVEAISMGMYGNFTNAVTPDIVPRMYPPATADRLARAKAVWDPGNLFSRNHNVVPAAR